MGNGVCSRRQRRIFQCLLVLTVVCGVFYGGMMSYEMHKQLRRTEAMALKYQQHQESLSAQLQGKESWLPAQSSGSMGPSSRPKKLDKRSWLA